MDTVGFPTQKLHLFFYKKPNTCGNGPYLVQNILYIRQKTVKIKLLFLEFIYYFT